MSTRRRMKTDLRGLSSKSRDKPYFLLAIAWIGIITGTIGLVASTSNFFIGFHNLDSGWNERIIEITFDVELCDYHSYDECRTPHELVIDGSDTIVKNYYNGLIGAFLFSVSFTIIIIFGDIHVVQKMPKATRTRRK